MTSSDKIALYCRDEEISYRSLIGWTASLARQHGAGPKERVVICAENQPGWVAAFYSAWRTQSIPVPVDVTATVDEIAYVIKDCQPSAIFTSKAVVPNLQAAAAKAGCDVRVIILEDHPAPATITPGDDDFPDNPMDDIAVIIYTSGTTGSPKGV
ncbi:MAG TPA: class I adenylate-forming enzyme family protein, partial [Lentisphaeria bacterium]|nr:class I adenylate-forming enzyme family protein [Lentisphaeria bacterium]